MSSLHLYLARVTEEGDNVDAYAEILPGPAGFPLHDLVITRQDATASRLGDYYEIHGRYGFIVLIRGELDVLLDGCPLHLTAGEGLIHVPFQTHYFIQESPDALLCNIMFACADDRSWRCLRRAAFRMPAHWETRHAAILRHWLRQDATAAATHLSAQLAACAELHSTRAPAIPRLFADLQSLLEQPGICALRVKELAARLNLTPNYLNSAHRAVYGAPLGTYLEHRRFGLALFLLADASIPIAAIAAQTGFLTTSSFCRKMRTWSGLTPGQCRDILLSATPHIRFTPFGQAIAPGTRRARY